MNELKLESIAQGPVNFENPEIPVQHNLLDAEIFEPISLLDAPIKKVDVAPVIASTISSVLYSCRHKAEEGFPSDRSVGVFAPGIDATAKSITKGYNGTVGAVIGMKLPVNEEFLNDYFDEDQIEGLNTDNIVRMQFDATLTSLGITRAVSRVSAVVYQRDFENGRRNVYATGRKADYLPAALVMRSLVNQSRGTRIIVDSNSYETLAGLPSLGKQSK